MENFSSRLNPGRPKMSRVLCITTDLVFQTNGHPEPTA